MVAVSSHDGQVVARVTDTGEGVAEHAGQDLFEPFFTTRNEQGAAGLGLAIARATARHTGAI